MHLRLLGSSGVQHGDKAAVSAVSAIARTTTIAASSAGAAIAALALTSVGGAAAAGAAIAALLALLALAPSAAGATISPRAATEIQGDDTHEMGAVDGHGATSRAIAGTGSRAAILARLSTCSGHTRATLAAFAVIVAPDVFASG